MHYILGLAAFGVSASAIQVSAQCTFPIAAVGNPGGPIVNEAIGENRIGRAFRQGVYSISPPSLSDSQGYNCIVDPSSAQFYCSQDTSGNANFSIANDGSLLHDGSAKWLACPVTGADADESYDIYADEKADTTGCQDITIMTGDASCEALSCAGPVTSNPPPITSAPTSVPPATPVSTVTASASSTASSTIPDPSCPKDLSSGEFRFPLLVLPTSPEAPDYAFGDSYIAYISSDNTTIFNFDVPDSSPYTGNCALLFLFPYASTLSLPNSPFYFSGIEEEEGENGGLDFALLKGVADPEVTYRTIPPVDTDYGKTKILPGNGYTIATFPCKSGTTSYSVSSVGNVELDYFQDSGSEPIGLYIVPCSS